MQARRPRITVRGLRSSAVEPVDHGRALELGISVVPEAAAPEMIRATVRAADRAGWTWWAARSRRRWRTLRRRPLAATRLRPGCPTAPRSAWAARPRSW